MRRLVIVLTGLLLMGVVHGAAIDDDFLNLSQTLIPAYYYAGIGEEENAIETLNAFYDTWNTFYSDYYYYNWNDTSWKSDFDSIDELVESLTNEMSGINLTNTYAVLSDVQGIIRTIRIRNKQENIIDYIIEFQEPLQGMIEQSASFDPTDYTDDEFVDLKALSSELLFVWQRINDFEIAEEDFDLDEEKIEALSEAMVEMNELMDGLRTAFSDQDTETISESIGLIKESYLNIMLTFGSIE